MNTNVIYCFILASVMSVNVFGGIFKHAYWYVNERRYVKMSSTKHKQINMIKLGKQYHNGAMHDIFLSNLSIQYNTAYKELEVRLPFILGQCLLCNDAHQIYEWDGSVYKSGMAG